MRLPNYIDRIFARIESSSAQMLFAYIAATLKRVEDGKEIGTRLEDEFGHPLKEAVGQIGYAPRKMFGAAFALELRSRIWSSLFAPALFLRAATSIWLRWEIKGVRR